MTAPVLTARNLTVRFDDDPDPVLEGLDIALHPGECVALVGESGSGKSVTARTLLGLAGPTARVDGAIELNGRRIDGLSERSWRALRGRRLGYVLQDALVSLDPLRTIGREVEDTLRLHTRMTPRERRARVRQLLTSVGLPDPALQAARRSGELSGGMRQRALIASALALSPGVLIADEPTTALDVGVQAQILDLLGELRSRGTAVLLVSHDLSVVGRVADTVMVMREGRVLEHGARDRVLDSPTHDYTRALLAAVPSRRGRRERLTVVTHDAPKARSAGPRATPPPEQTDPYEDRPVLELAHVGVSFPTPNGGLLRAIDDVSLTLAAGTTLGLVGESGSGKTTAARVALGLQQPDTGTVTLLGQRFSPLPERQRRGRRGPLGAISQDPYSSFDPRRTVSHLLADALTRGASRHADEEAVAQLLRDVGLSPSVAGRRPARLSGGQRQRVAIARALAASPRVLVCDEPVSSLDVLVQAQVLDLLDELQEARGLSLLLISHDMGVIAHMSDTVAVMSAGRVVEHGPARAILGDPQHPATRSLLEHVP